MQDLIIRVRTGIFFGLDFILESVWYPSVSIMLKFGGLEQN